MVTYNSIIYQGASWLEEITIPATDLTGMTGTCQIRKQASADSVVVASPDVTLVTPASGIFSLDLTGAETLAIPVTTKTLTDSTAYIYDVFFTDGTTTIRVASGTISVYAAVTR
jgi:hypothetical protein